MTELRKHEVVQIVATHRWAACLAVVDEPRSWGCTAYVMVPTAVGSAPAPIRLETKDFLRLGAEVIIAVDEG